MWREYTREKPARPGLAIGAAGLAFVGTMCLASLLVNQKNAPLRMQSLADWPIEFGLPNGFSLASESKLTHGDGRLAVYKLDRGDLGRSIRIQFEYVNDLLPPHKALERLFGGRLHDNEVDRIPFGREEGRFTVQGGFPPNDPKFFGALWRDGVAVGITFKPGIYDDTEMYEFQRICESVDFKDGR